VRRSWRPFGKRCTHGAPDQRERGRLSASYCVGPPSAVDGPCRGTGPPGSWQEMVAAETVTEASGALGALGATRGGSRLNATQQRQLEAFGGPWPGWRDWWPPSAPRLPNSRPAGPGESTPHGATPYQGPVGQCHSDHDRQRGHATRHAGTRAAIPSAKPWTCTKRSLIPGVPAIRRPDRPDRTPAVDRQ
jgi:hypothetical protein